MNHLEARVRQYSEIPIDNNQVKIVYEGNDLLINYPNDKSHKSEMKKISGENTLGIDELLQNPWSFLNKLDEMAKQIAQGRDKSVIDTVSEITEKFGLSTKRKGDPTGEDILEMLKGIRLDFTDDGIPVLPSFYCAPDMVEKVKVAFNEVFTLEELKERFEKIIELKKQEHNDQENNRKLVD